MSRAARREGAAPPGARGAAVPDIRLGGWVENGVERPVLGWAAGPGWRMISSAVVGGGIGERAWWLNAGVPRDYARMDPDVHVAEIAVQLAHEGAGVGMLTAADVRTWTQAEDGGVHVAATVGLGVPVLAAAPAERIAGEVAAVVGTINILAVLPVPLTDAALVNAVLTATEAKTQALVEHAVPGTGTSSDAVCIACPVSLVPRLDSAVPGGAVPGGAVLGGAVPGGAVLVEPFGGPRSTWGARLARAVHAAVSEGTARWLDHHPAGAPHRS